MSSPPPLAFLHPFQPTRFLPVLADRWVKVPPRIRFVGGASLHPPLVSFLLGERRKESANGAQGRGGGWTIVRRRRNEIPRPLSPYRLEKDVEETFAYIDRQFSARTNPRAAFRLPFTAVEMPLPFNLPPPQPVFLYSNVSHHRFTIRVRIGGIFFTVAAPWNEI